MGTTWIIISVGVANLAILDSEFESFPKFFCIVSRQQSNSLDCAIVFDPHGFNFILKIPKEVSQLLHVNLSHPACHCQWAFKFNGLFFDIFYCTKDDSRLFFVALNREGLSTSCLAITYYCRISTINRFSNNIFCFFPYNFLVGLFRKCLVKGIKFFFVISLDWLSLF